MGHINEKVKTVKKVECGIEAIMADGKRVFITNTILRALTRIGEDHYHNYIPDDLVTVIIDRSVNNLENIQKMQFLV